MKSWRPEGWNNPYAHGKMINFARLITKLPDGRCMDLRECQNNYDSFEDGADALLELLKKEGIKVSKGQIADPIGSTYVRNGWMVFIPEEVNDGNISI